MKLKIGVVFFTLASACLASGCLNRPLLSNPATTLMTYNACSAASYCTIVGKLFVRPVNHVKMGRLELPDGACVNVSLPPKLITRAEAKPGEVRTISGKVGHGSWDENLAWLKVNGRRIGLSQCGDFYVFVR